MTWCWTFSSVFSTPITMIIEFRFSFIVMVYYIHWLAYIKPHLHFWITPSPTWSWCVIFLMCCCIQFASVFLRIFASVFIVVVGQLISFLWQLCAFDVRVMLILYPEKGLARGPLFKIWKNSLVNLYDTGIFPHLSYICLGIPHLLVLTFGVYSSPSIYVLLPCSLFYIIQILKVISDYLLNTSSICSDTPFRFWFFLNLFFVFLCEFHWSCSYLKEPTISLYLRLFFESSFI